MKYKVQQKNPHFLGINQNKKSQKTPLWWEKTVKNNYNTKRHCSDINKTQNHSRHKGKTRQAENAGKYESSSETEKTKIRVRIQC